MLRPYVDFTHSEFEFAFGIHGKCYKVSQASPFSSLPYCNPDIFFVTVIVILLKADRAEVKDCMAILLAYDGPRYSIITVISIIRV